MPADPTGSNGTKPPPRIEPNTESNGAAADGSLEAATAEQDELDEPAETPFDHPLFLPAILAGLWVWFGYDGFINQDPEMLEHLAFNRGGFAVLTVLTAWFGYKGWKELSERNATRSAAPDS
jgi:hypothetical protein